MKTKHFELSVMNKKALSNAQLIGLDQGSTQSDAFMCAPFNEARSMTQNVYFLSDLRDHLRDPWSGLLAS